MPPAQVDADTVDALTAALVPFAAPRSTTRTALYGSPENDVMKVEVKMADYWRAQVMCGTLSSEMLDTLPAQARPSNAFIAEIKKLESDLGLDD